MRRSRREAPFETRLETPVAAVRQRDGGVEVHARDGEAFTAQRSRRRLAVERAPGIEFDPPLSERKRRAIELGQASRGIKIFIRARGQPVVQNAIKPGHPFGYLDTEVLYAGRDAAPDRVRARRRGL